MSRKVGTLGYQSKDGIWSIEVIDYTERVREHSVGMFHVSPAEFNKGIDYVTQLVVQKVYGFMVDAYGEDVSYTLDERDF